MIYLRITFIFLLSFGLLIQSGCSNMPFVKTNKAPSRLFLTDFSTAWTSAIEAISAGSDVIKIQNRETGIIETNWIDNTESRQFLDVFTNEDFFLRSRYRLQVQLREGKYDENQAVLVRILRFQQKETTFLGGWQEVESDGLEESISLYRIGRLIAMQQYNEEQMEAARRIDDEEE